MFLFLSTKTRFFSFSIVLIRRDQLARYCMEDVMENRLLGEEDCIFGKDDISKVCECFRTVVYNQQERIMSETGDVVYINA